MYMQMVASATTILAFLGIALKPVRARVSGWLGELFTERIQAKMVSEIGGIRQDLYKDRVLSTRRHKANVKELKTLNSRIGAVEKELAK